MGVIVNVIKPCFASDTKTKEINTGMYKYDNKFINNLNYKADI